MAAPAQVVAEFQRDFVSGATAGVDRAGFTNLNNGWAYLWNAPIGWTTNGLSGDGASGAIGDPAHYVPLFWSGSLNWTADGDATNGNNQPSGFLRLGSGNGHPGLGSTQTGNVGNTQDRYVIAAYEIRPQDGAGAYVITGSSIAGATATATPLRVVIHVNNRPPLVDASYPKDGVARGFDVDLGELAVGDRLFVAVGPDGNAGSDSFNQFNFAVRRNDHWPIPPNPPPPPPGGPLPTAGLINPGAEINPGVEGRPVGSPDVPGWQCAGNVIVTRQQVGPRNGRWCFALDENAALFQLSDTLAASNQAAVLVFEAANLNGVSSSITAELFIEDGSGGRQAVAGRTFSFASTAPGDWQLFELVVYFGELNGHAGKRLGVQFRGPSGGLGRVLGVDDVAFKSFDGVREPPVCAVSWSNSANGPWPGPEFWANRPQDWAVSNGWFACLSGSASLPFRTAHLLTRRLGTAPANFALRARLAWDSTNAAAMDSLGGCLLGAGPRLDYRGAALIHHRPGKDGGLAAGVDGLGRASIWDNSGATWQTLVMGALPTHATNEVELEVAATCLGALYRLDVRVFETDGQTVRSAVTLYPVEPARLIGNVALVSHPGSGTTRHRFAHFRAEGARLEAHDERALGPIMSAQHTLSERVLKMTAQLMPVATAEVAAVSLQIRTNDAWQTLAAAPVNPEGFVAVFRVPDWNAAATIPYRLEARRQQPGMPVLTQYWSGVIRADPVEKPVIVLAAFTGNMSIANKFNGVTSAANPVTWTEEHIAVPHNQVVAHVSAQQPDLLFFSGDQVYEGGNPTGADAANIELDYLYKWYLWCWAYRELTRDIPCLCIPDDHDVYQGNLWGQGGRAIATQENGGYTRPAPFVRLVERTQTSNLPDPYDPTPVEQGIGVYYTRVKYGRIGFAVIEDRKFKHGLQGLPARSPTDPAYDTDQLDLPDKELLGPRQEAFLAAWGQDWRGEEMKAVLSQTIFADLNTHAGEGLARRYFDLDTNGWPQSKRRRAVDLIRRAFALMVGGDQHLATVAHHGIETYGDAGVSFCVPSVLNAFPRVWDPLNTNSGPTAQVRPYQGQWLDGFKHPIIMRAAVNPAIYYQTTMGMPPATVHDRAAGYGLVRFDKTNHRLTLECWPRFADPRDPATGGQYPGWPVTIRSTDNYGRAPFGFLPAVEAPGLARPVVQVIAEAGGEVLYTLRAPAARFRPHVFANGLYTVIASDPESGWSQTFSNQSVAIHLPHQIHNFAASSPYVISNSSIRLCWDVTGARGITITPALGDVASNTFNGIGEIQVNPQTNTIYLLTSTNELGQSLQSQVEVRVFESLESWRQRHFAAADLGDPAKETTLWGDRADPDGDGLVNLLEFALTTDPRADSRASLPRLSVTTLPGHGASELFLQFTVRGLLNVAGVTYEVQVSSDLSVWQPLTDLPAVAVGANPGPPGETGTHTWRGTEPLRQGTAGRWFFRLALRPPP